MFLKKKINRFLLDLWSRSNGNNLHLIERWIFLIFILFEKIYSIAFKIICFFKKIIGNRSLKFKVISVGNISVGGTGKSVFVQFLSRKLNNNCAVILRGYGAKNKKSKIINDGKKVFYPANIVGDEPFMLAKSLGIPIVVGKNRFKSSKVLDEFLIKFHKDNVHYLILDDGYQNFSIKKDLEILLLDSRKPLENSHCLPAGALREKDLNRADIVVFTHANKVSNFIPIEQLIRKGIPIFYGRHKFSSLLHLNKKETDIEKLKGKKILAFAGIANFNYFTESISDLGLNVFREIKYSDHHRFLESDLKYIISCFNESGADYIITTSKDWVKIYPFVKDISKWCDLPIYVLEIEFEFLNEDDNKRFLDIIGKI